MKEIQWFNDNGIQDGGGWWAKRSAVEALQKELEDMSAKAIAAVWLIPEDANITGLQQLAKEAREVFSGEDRKTIARLQDEIANLQEALRHASRPPMQGITAVYGVKPGGPAYKDVRIALMLTRIDQHPNGGFEIEVKLP
jgi:hypothetical protein